MKKVLMTACICVSLAGLGWVATAAPAQYTLNWWTVDGGGGRSLGGDFVLNGTAGQPDGGTLTGGDYTLGGGYWAGGELPSAGQSIYLPLVLR